MQQFTPEELGTAKYEYRLGAVSRAPGSYELFTEDYLLRASGGAAGSFGRPHDAFDKALAATGCSAHGTSQVFFSKKARRLLAAAPKAPSR